MLEKDVVHDMMQWTFPMWLLEIHLKVKNVPTLLPSKFHSYVFAQEKLKYLSPKILFQ